MIQRVLLLVLLCASLITGAQAAEPESLPQQSSSALPQKKPQKTPEEAYLEGLSALAADDTGSAAVALAGINPVSPYAKLLQAQLAWQAHDADTPLRLLIPLQAENGLIPQARGSLHATLALAYEAQENVLGALEQRVKAEPYIETAAVEGNQSAIWKLLTSQAREALVEMRGESADAVVQGWIDLALAAGYSGSGGQAVAHWRSAYPDHPASAALLASLAAQPASETPSSGRPAFSGRLALLLPLDMADFAAVAGAVRAGVQAALTADGSHAEVVVYPTGSEAGVVGQYQRAVQEGASFIIGPLTRNEVNQLAGESLTVPVLTLNFAEAGVATSPMFFQFGLPVEGEVREVVRHARSRGLQTAWMVASHTPLGERMAKNFAEAWQAEDGKLAGQMELPPLDQRTAIKGQMAQIPADMVFLALDAAEAQEIRPWLDQSIPAYGTSHVYDGRASSVLNHDLLAVHFVDQPWMIEPDRPEFAGLRPIDRPDRAELERLYALGLDAARLAAVLKQGADAGHALLEGASGRIVMQENRRLARELPLAQFLNDGVALEPSP